jgi:uncharacterized membrane protein
MDRLRAPWSTAHVTIHLLDPITRHAPAGLLAVTATTPAFGPLVTATAVGCGIAGGVFFAFSMFVMPALDRLTPPQSIASMQAINEAAPNPLFMLLLFGTAAASVALGISAVKRWGEPGTALQLVAVALYLVAIVVTAAYHVPHNDALARLDPNVADAGHRWSVYSAGWTAWNHVRTVTPIAAATLLTISRRFSR